MLAKILRRIFWITDHENIGIIERVRFPNSEKHSQCERLADFSAQGKMYFRRNVSDNAIVVGSILGGISRTIPATYSWRTSDKRSPSRYSSTKIGSGFSRGVMIAKSNSLVVELPRPPAPSPW